MVNDSTKTNTTPTPSPPRVGDALAALRQARGLSLQDLSRSAGVSKSMLSQIERSQANPTVAVVWRLSNALGVGISELLLPSAHKDAPVIEKVAAHATPSLRTPDGKGELRILSPIDLAGQFEWYALTMQAGAVLESQAHGEGTQEHLTVLSGTLDVRLTAEQMRVKSGETARYCADCVHAVSNSAKSVATAWLVVVHR